MSEARELTVKLSLDSNSFSRGMKMVSAQLKNVDSAFKATTAGTDKYSTRAQKATARVGMLTDKIALQQAAVTLCSRQYGNAQSNLERWRKKQAEAAKAVAKATSEYGENSEQAKAARKEYDKATRSLENAQVATTNAQTALNNAQRELSATSRQLQDAQDEQKLYNSAWGKTSEALEKAGSSLTTVGKRMVSVGSTLTRTVTAPVVALGTAAVRTFTSYDDSLRQVQATMGLVAGSSEEADRQIALLDETAQRMGIETRYSASEAAEALNYLALAGYDADTACEVLPDILNLAQAGGLDLAYASDLATDAMAALGLETKDLGMFTDQMARTAQKSNTSVAQLGEAILTVGGTAKNMAGGTAEMNAALGVLANRGIKGAEGGTHLRNILLALPTEKTSKALKKLGVSAYNADGSVRPLNETFADLNRAMEGMSDEDKTKLLTSMFNKTDLAAVQALLAGCGEEYDNLFSAIQNSKGTTAQMASIMESGIGGQFRSLKSAIEGLAISFGAELAPAVKQGAKFVTDLTKRFAELPKSTKQTITRFAALAAVIGPSLLVVGKIATTFGTLLTGASKAVAVIGKFALGIKTLAAGGALKTLIGGFKNLVAFNGGGIGGAVKSIGALGKAFATSALGATALVTAAAGVIAYLAWINSDAKKVRDAIKGMNDTAENWKSTSATTFYSTSSGLEFFGLSTDNFKRDVTSMERWLTSLKTTWSTTKRKSDDTVTAWVDSWKEYTNGTRTAIQGMKQDAAEYGMGSVVSTMDADLKLLDQYDRRAEQLIRRSRYRSLTPEEDAELQSLIQGRHDIEIKYHLTNADVKGFDDIRKEVQREIDRATARGEEVSTTIYENAVVAAAQGYHALTDEIDESYDSQRDLIDLMDEGAEKTAAREALDARYAEERKAAASEYRDLLQDTAGAVFGKESVIAASDGLQELAAATIAYTDAVARGESGAAEMERINTAMSGLDQNAVTELTALYSQMKTAGFSDADIAEMFPEISPHTLEAVAALTDFATNDKSGNFTGLKDMFGDLGEEVLKITTDLDMTGAQAAWAAFAADPGAIVQMSGEITGDVPLAEGATVPTPMVEAAVSHFTAEGVDIDNIEPEGLAAWISEYQADNPGTANIEPKDLQAAITSYTANGASVPTPMVEAAIEHFTAEGVDTDNIEPEGLAAWIDQYQANNPDVSGIEPKDLQAAISSYTAEGATPPEDVTVWGNIKLRGLAGSYYYNYLKNTGIEVAGRLTLGQFANEFTSKEAMIAYLTSQGATAVVDGIDVPITPEVAAQLSASDLVVTAEDGSVHVLVTPEYASPEMVETDKEGLSSTKDSLFGFKTYAGSIKSYIDDAREAVVWLDAIGDGLFGSQRKGAEGAFERLSKADAGFEQTVNFVRDYVSAVQNGQAVSEEATQLFDGIVKLADYTEKTGVSDSGFLDALTTGLTEAGIAMQDSPLMDGSALIDTLMQTQSMAQQAGEAVGGGAAEGMESGSAGAGAAGDYAGSAFVNAAGSYEGAAFAAGQRVGGAFSRGVETKLDINSPSRVLRKDGRFAGLGLVKGFADEQRDLERVVNNAANIITGCFDTRGRGVTNNNQKSYTANSNLHVDTMVMTGDMDAQAMAEQMARINRRRLLGYGIA